VDTYQSLTILCFSLFKTIRLTQYELKSVTFLEISLCAGSTGKITENINGRNEGVIFDSPNYIVL